MRAFENFMEYKTRVPVRGAIMLNENMDSVVLVKGWKKGASWSFPRGKIAKDEDDLTCAIREVYEETGLELDTAGLVPGKKDVKSIDVDMRDQNMKLFVFRNVPMDTQFAPRTRKEISKIQWWALSDLPAFRKKGNQQENTPALSPNKFYMVAPFLVHLRKWVIEQKKKDAKEAKRTTSNQYLAAANTVTDDFLTEEDQGAESAAQASTYESTPAPELDTLEGATAALSRLLKIQPATEGLQAEAVAQEANSKGTGSALLALLHSKPAASTQPTPVDAPPRTPMEHIDTNPSMPKTPHHYPPRPPPFSSMPPPPNFPIQPQDDTFSYQLPHTQNLHQQNRTPNFQRNHNVGNQNDPRAPTNPHHYQPQHLIHPQPLPPHVQKAVFTGGPVHAPAMPQPAHQTSAPRLQSTVSIAVSNPQFPGLHAPMVPASVEPKPKLTAHSLAMLDAFKSRDRAAIVPTQSDLSLRGFPPPPVVPKTQIQELPAAEAQHHPQAHPPPPIFVQPHNGVLEKSALTPKQPISESQKSALLNIFKSPTPSTASLAVPLSATALPTNGTPSAVELSAVEPLSANALTTSALLNDRRTPDHMVVPDTLPIFNPESKLPYHATSILSRPVIEKKDEGQLKPVNGGTKRNIGKAPARVSEIPTVTQSPAKFQPQILKRPVASSPRAIPSPTALPMSPPTLLNHASSARTPVQATSHQQSLLSLFAKAQTPVVTSPSQGEFTSVNQNLPQLKPTGRSRVGSLASGSGDGGASRRGSQTPISPADRGFLLSYLDDVVAKGSQR
jgi:mRNA-decapping enzyme subunit 2